MPEGGEVGDQSALLLQWKETCSRVDVGRGTAFPLFCLSIVWLVPIHVNTNKGLL